tara:strand:+ start:738 stop:1001 length:264 start_codon:yes stop_codon:yes gene_type:complete
MSGFSSPFMAKSPLLKGHPKRIRFKGDYKVGDLPSEDDFEAKFKQIKGDSKTHPQLSVQDYSSIRKDDKGFYVERLKKGEKDKSDKL